jgi:predicted transcriptional regulator
MSTLSIKLDDSVKRALEVIADIERKTLNELIGEIIYKKVNENFSKVSDTIENDEIKEAMKLSEISFSEWDNEEDEIYDKL